MHIRLQQQGLKQELTVEHQACVLCLALRAGSQGLCTRAATLLIAV